MRIFRISVIILTCMLLVYPAIAEYKWKVVGGNPYRGTTGWAIGNSGWPDNVQMALLTEFLADRFKDGKICGGMTLDFATFGDKGVEERVYTDWPVDKCYATTEYSILYEDTAYTLVNIWKCSNWGGYSIKDVEEPLEAVPLPPDEPRFTRGRLVQFNCFRFDGTGCGNC